MMKNTLEEITKRIEIIQDVGTKYRSSTRLNTEAWKHVIWLTMEAEGWIDDLCSNTDKERISVILTILKQIATELHKFTFPFSTMMAPDQTDWKLVYKETCKIEKLLEGVITC